MNDPLSTKTEKIAEGLAQKQLEAYNAKDIEQFAACYAPDVEVRRQGDQDLILKGRAALHEHYAKMFANSPALSCELVNRIVMGRFVFDEERVSGRSGSSDVARVVAIYEIVGEHIGKVWFAAP